MDINMKRKSMIAAMIAVSVVFLFLTGCSFSKHKDITGVTTLPKENTVIMNSLTGKEFVSGAGKITVSEGEIIHLKCELSEGSFDLAFNAGDGSLDIFQNTDLENLPSEGEVFGLSGITGKSQQDFNVPVGEYTVFFNLHGAIGSAAVSITN